MAGRPQVLDRGCAVLRRTPSTRSSAWRRPRQPRTPGGVVVFRWVLSILMYVRTANLPDFYIRNSARMHRSTAKAAPDAMREAARPVRSLRRGQEGGVDPLRSFYLCRPVGQAKSYAPYDVRVLSGIRISQNLPSTHSVE